MGIKNKKEIRGLEDFTDVLYIAFEAYREIHGHKEHLNNPNIECKKKGAKYFINKEFQETFASIPKWILEKCPIDKKSLIERSYKILKIYPINPEEFKKKAHETLEKLAEPN